MLALVVIPVKWLAAGRNDRSIAAARWSTAVIERGASHGGKAFSLAWICAAVALASPVLINPNQSTGDSRLRDIALVMDISPSMTLNDLEPSRLKRAQWEVDRLIEETPGARFGLIAFSANAYVALPLTMDRSAVRTFANALDPAMVARRGSNVQRALDLAAQMLDESAEDGRAIVLLSDGDFDPALPAANSPGIPVVTLGIGTTAGAPVTDREGQALLENGMPVISRLQGATLRAIASRSSGFYQTARADDGDTRQIVQWIEALSAGSLVRTPGQGNISLTQPLLLLSTILFLIARFGVPGTQTARFAALALGLGASDVANAGSLLEHSAWKAYSSGNFEQALERYGRASGFDSLMGRGAAAYRLGLWQESREAFEEAERAAPTDELRAKAAFNQGNAWAQLGDLDQAIAAYRSALRYAPGYSRAGLNLDQLTLRTQSNTEASPPGDDAAAAHIAGALDDTGQSDNCTAGACSDQSLIPSSAELGSTESTKSIAPRDPVTELLKNRFSRQDYLDGLSRGEARPW